MPLLPEMEEVLNQFAQERKTALKRFVEFHGVEEPLSFLDVSQDVEKAEEVLAKILHKYNCSKDDLNRSNNRAIVTEIVKTLARTGRISGRQIAEMTGINREKIRRIIVPQEPSP